MTAKRKHADPIPNPYVEVTDNVPVVSPNTTPQNFVALGSILSTVILWLVNQYLGPLSAEQLAIIVSAINIVVGLVVAALNRYRANSVTTTSLTPKMKIRKAHP